MNLKIIVAPIVVLIIGIGVFSFISSDENVEISEDVVVIQSEEPGNYLRPLNMELLNQYLKRKFLEWSIGH